MPENRTRIVTGTRPHALTAVDDAFIGADGTNPTQNSGRLSITLKPRKERDAAAERWAAWWREAGHRRFQTGAEHDHGRLGSLEGRDQ